MLADDRDLTKDNVMGITNRDALVSFFAHLGYRTDARQFQTVESLGISQSGLKAAVKHIERVSADGSLQVYLFEVATVTLAHRRAVTTLLNNRDGDFMFVLTTPNFERLDFVLIEKSSKEASAQDSGPRVRPLGVTVERRKPTREVLRTLRRLTYTCADDLGQLEKLLSAFRIAQWSEPRFNNVALFSDHYLNTRLPDEPEWQDVDALKAAFKTFRALGDRNKSDQAKSVEEVVLPVLKLLGFDPKSATAADAGSMLRLSDNLVCFAYPWLRELDSKDVKDTARSEDVPAVRVVTEFEKTNVPWAILTNGKFWRLYCAKAHGRHANFYEIDFREMLADRPEESGEQGRGDSFKYFWLILRTAAFAPGVLGDDGKPGPSFLDKLFEGSRTFAKELGERLKSRVFEEIFPHFADGFVAHMRQIEGKDAEFTEERLAEVFRATLTLLYRLIFLLYAESRDLLPVAEDEYRQISLRRLAQELAQRAGVTEADADAKLTDAYSPSETALYDRVAELFRVIDQGDAARNVPLYNGGLFLTAPAPDDESDEAKAARFLAKHKIPDRYLAIGLDRLAREEDPKRLELVPVDYKSLGVRHLGSIYEGLLEFKVRVAAERMALVKGKKGELIVTAREAEKEGLKVLTRSKMYGADGGFLRKGSVFLENDKHERKATGSYYTPDYIVKYIVENTVGPVLEENFNELRPEFRKAEAAYHAARKQDASLKAGGFKGDDPEKVANTYTPLVDRLFTLRVLDPAMGSGHFLVEAVDFITDRMLAFLSGFGWNPVQWHIQRTRREILNSLQKAEIAVDAGRLTDINLLKRHVLKRCIFGVDLNPMAVELAKVSLWLDCFTLGAPLSFLDHHLKPGNSLVGVTVDEVEKAQAQARGATKDLFGTRFQGLLLAAEIGRQVAAVPDSTAEQASKSRSEHKRAQDALAPFKRILDIYTSQWFGNGPTDSVSGIGKKSGGKVAALEWLNSEAADELLKADRDGYVEEDVKAIGEKNQKRMLDNSRQKSMAESTRRKPSITDKVDSKADAWFNNVPKIATKARAEHRFFHWELEFPEVFYAPTTPTGQAVKRVDGAGFDVLVGNPPYINVKRGMNDYAKSFFEHRYMLAVGQWDQGVLFFERGLALQPQTSLLASSGGVGLICPKPFLLSESYEPLRIALLGRGNTLVGPCGECFTDAGVEGAVCIAGSKPLEKVVFVDGRKDEVFRPLATAGYAALRVAPFTLFSYMMPTRLYDQLYSRHSSELTSLGEAIAWTRGAEMGKRDEAVLHTFQHGALPLLTGEDVEPFIARSRLWIAFDERNEQVFKPLRIYKRNPKLLMRRVANTLMAAVDVSEAVTLNTLYVAEMLLDDACPFALCALLNAAPTRALFAAVFNHDDTLFPYVRVSQLDRLLIPRRALRNATLRELGRKLSGTVSGQDRHVLLDELSRVVFGLYGLSASEVSADFLLGSK